MQFPLVVWSLGKSDGKFMCSESNWKVLDDFEGKEIIAAHLGFALGSTHVWAYGVQADGAHSYTVESIQQHFHYMPDGEYYGYPTYLITLGFTEDLTPNSHWTRIGCKSAEKQHVYFSGPDREVEGVRCMDTPRLLMYGERGKVLRNQSLELDEAYVQKLMSFKEIPFEDKEPWQMTWPEFLSTVPDAVYCGGAGGYTSKAYKEIRKKGMKLRYRFHSSGNDYWVDAKVTKDPAELGEFEIMLLEDVTWKRPNSSSIYAPWEDVTWEKGTKRTVYGSECHPMPDNDVYVAYQEIRKKAYLEGKQIGADDYNRSTWAKEALKAGKKLQLQCLADVPRESGLHHNMFSHEESCQLSAEYRALLAKRDSKPKKNKPGPTITREDSDRITALEALGARSDEASRQFYAVERALKTCQPVAPELLAKYPDLEAKFRDYPFG